MDGVAALLFGGLLLGLVLLLAVLMVLRSLLATAWKQHASAPSQSVPGAAEDREAALAQREARLVEGLRQLAEENRVAQERSAKLEERESEAQRLVERRRRALERASGLSSADARAELLADIATEAKREAALLRRRIEAEAREEAEARAREIIAGAVQRLATAQTTESVLSAVDIPSEQMKGRIIGREGRNVRAFEAVTGTNLVVDDTPGTVQVSCFDPVRREVGRRTLASLVADGRIHPARIEETCERSRREVEDSCLRAGEEALTDTGVTDMHPELVALLGRLRYRTSYGQNVLGHLVEAAHCAGLMAAELGLEVAPVKRAALLHDVGKALSHELEGSHALVGADYARRWGEHPDVVHAIEAHHNEVEPQTVEAVLVQAADAVSGGRPGARRDSAQTYTERLRRLEQIARSAEGVERAFAMRAGREVRVMVCPQEVDDVQAQVIARDIAKRVEEELTYPGQIRVTVVRESRAIEVAR